MIKLICYIVPVSYIFELSRHNYWQLVHNLLWMYNHKLFQVLCLIKSYRETLQNIYFIISIRTIEQAFLFFYFLLNCIYYSGAISTQTWASTIINPTQLKMYNKNSNLGFLIPKNMANYEASLWSFLSSSKTPKIVRSATKQNIYDLYVIQKQIL